MGEDISKKISINTTDAKTNLQALKLHVKELESGFKSSAAGMKDWSKDANTLEQRSKSLKAEIAAQKIVVSNLKDEYKKLLSGGMDPLSKEAIKLRTRINEEEGSLNGMKRALDSTKKGLQENSASSKMAEGAFKTLGVGIKGLAAASAVVVTALAGIAAGIGKMVLNTASASDDLMDMSAQTSISVETIAGAELHRKDHRHQR